ncbi:MAG: RagB/SusD family nutrient uptake outer membrane protein [Flavisolibacter sp.]|nr:RagB/SusD family nutrient uptake outer membrane protein [Flavisolibacter sp.]
MKNRAIIICLASLSMMLSCKKSFIERNPVSSVTIDALYKTDKDFQDAVIGIYQALRNQYNNMWQFGDLRGDDAWIQVSNQPSSTGVDVFSINSSDALLNNTWSNYYIVINRANNVLTRIADADPAVIKNKDRYIGEAKFLRALAYFDLVRIFGDVQMITNVPTVEEVLATPRTPVATVYSEVIIKDLLDAGTKLPIVYTGTEVGRATRGAAKAILGKVYLTVKDFPKAEAVLQELTKAPYTYALLPNFNDLFDYTKNEHHSEYIFDIEYEEGLGGLGSPFTNAFMPNVTAMLNYYGIRGGFNESLSPTMQFVNAWQPGDKRKDITVQCCGSWRNPTTGAVTTFNSTTSQSYTMKYITPVATQNDSRANWKVVRYADVLLMLAEAMNENGKTTEALPYLNLVRKRAGLSDYSGLTQEQARNAIAEERRFELAFEGHRWFDLVRTGKALEKLAPVGMKEYMTVFPVPLNQIKVMNNPTLFSQNPGYNF